jgi:hypothetical protein
MTDESLGAAPHVPVLPWRGTRRFRLHLPVDDDRLNTFILAVAGTELSAPAKTHLFWFRFRCAVRWVGWVAGLFTILLAVLVVALLAVAAVTHATAPTSVVLVWSTILVDLLTVGFFAWAYLYLAFVAFDPSTSFARAAFETAREIPSKANGWTPSSGYAFANSTGVTARALFRVITGRRINVSVRPDVAKQAAQLAAGVMTVVPQEGSRFWREHTAEANNYAALLHDINALVAIKRSDLLLDLLMNSPLNDSPELLVVGDATDTLRYLHPLGGHTTLDAIVRYVVPILALPVSAAAVIATVWNA